MNTNKNFSRFSARYAMVIVAGLAAFWLLGSAPHAHAAISTFSEGIVIGGTSISGGLLLDVNGNVGANQFCNASGGGCVSAGSIGTVWTTSGSDIYNTNSANVGIGTSNPQHKLHTTGNIRADGRHLFLGSSQDIYGNNTSAIYYDSNHSSVSEIILRDASNNTLGRLRGDAGADIGIMDDQGDWAIEHRRDNWTRWLINNGEKMRLTPTGLGVGTNSPNSDLHVSGGWGSVNLLLEADTNNSGETNQPSITLSQDGGLVQSSLGYLDGSNSLTLENKYSADLLLGTNNTTHVNIRSDGKVGIGTNAPTTKLDVNGHIRTPNQLRANNICDPSGGNCFGGRGDRVFQCPVYTSSDSCKDTCYGQLSRNSSCVRSDYYSDKSGSGCNTTTYSCNAVGWLVN